MFYQIFSICFIKIKKKSRYQHLCLKRYLSFIWCSKTLVLQNFKQENFKLFRVDDMYESVRYHGNRLLFQWTSVEGEVGIMGSGFRSDVTAVHGRRHGNGTYLSPQCNTAQKFSKTSNGRKYVFVVEVVLSDHQFRENPKSDNLSFNVYRSDYGIDWRFDLADSNGNFVSEKLLRRENRWRVRNCWRRRKFGADEYVVRNQQFLLPRYFINNKKAVCQKNCI